MSSWVFIRLLLSIVADGEVLVTDDEADLPLACFAAHPSAEGAERGEVGAVLNIGGGRVAVDDDGLVHDEGAAALVVAPHALGLRVGGRAAEDAPEHLERGVDPALLVDRRRAVTFDARASIDQYRSARSVGQEARDSLGKWSASLGAPSTRAS